MSNRYGHHQKCVLAHISAYVKRSGPKGVGRLHSKADGGGRLVGSVWGGSAVGAVVGYTKNVRDRGAARLRGCREILAPTR